MNLYWKKQKKINAIVASEDALFPGRIRNGGVEVSTLQGKYIPKLKDEAIIQSDFQKLLDSDYSITEKALRLFLYMSKNQIFWDGNKDAHWFQPMRWCTNMAWDYYPFLKLILSLSMNIYPITTTATRLVKKGSCFILCMIIVSLALTTNLKQTYLADS